jgi:hypothetical protein
MKNEPLVTVATITALVTACIGLLTAFGLDLTSDQQTAILGVVAVVAPLVVAAFTRSKVTPVNKS